MPRFVTREIVADALQAHEQVHIASSFEELSDHVKRGANPLKPEQQCMDYATVFRNGVDWVLEYMRLQQPMTHRMLARAEVGLWFAEGILVSPDGERTWTRQAFLRFGDRLAVIEPYLQDATLEHEGESHLAFHRYASLPLPIAQAYYSRVAGFKVSHLFPATVMESRVLPAVIFQWKPARALCPQDKKQASNMTAALRNVCDDPELPHDELGDTFRIVVDTREEGVYEPAGDFLLVDENSRSGRIYHVKDSDFTALSLVEDPVRLFDEYGSHVLAGSTDRFAFEPFLRRI